MKRFFYAVLATFSLVACNHSPTSIPQTPSFYLSMAKADARLDTEMARDMINAYRRNNGLSPLILDPKLQTAAQDEANTMAMLDRPSSAETIEARLSSAGILMPAANLSAGYRTLAEAFSGWRESEPHNKVLLESHATRMGIATAFAPNSKYQVYWIFLVASESH